MSQLFKDELVAQSENDNFIEAAKEWLVTGVTEEKNIDHYCPCGQKLKYLFTITNKINDNVIFPIGSSCVLKCDNLVDSHNSVIHKHKSPELYCKKCGQRHRKKDSICNICKNGEKLIKFGKKHKNHSYNYIWEKDRRWFDWMEENTNLIKGPILKWLTSRRNKPVLI